MYYSDPTMLFDYDDGETKLNHSIVKHQSIMFFQSYKRRYSNYGEVVLCADGPNSWRKDFYPYYKANRKRDVEVDNGGLNWKDFFSLLNVVRDEMKTNMPYKVMHLDRVEGDDCIAVLAKNVPGPHVIISNDKDFGQLQRFDGVIQWSPLKEKEIIIEHPLMFLKEQIIRGDGVDFVPNILSDDDVLVTKEKRQKSIFKKKMDDYLLKPLEDNFDADKIARNRKMIDFEEIPEEYINKILEQWESQQDKKVSKSDMMTYFVKNRLIKHLDDLQQF